MMLIGQQLTHTHTILFPFASLTVGKWLSFRQNTARKKNMLEAKATKNEEELAS
jgi:hypothetical protein